MASERIVTAPSASRIRWRASLDFLLVIIWRCGAPCCGWNACSRCSGSQSARRVCSALYADARQQIADAIRVRCNQLSVLCGRLATTGLGETSEHATCFAALSAYTWLDGRLAGLERECFAANSQARFETDYVKHHQEVHAEVLDALSRHLPRPSQHYAYATLRKSPRVAFGGTLVVPPTDDVQVPPPVVSGATDAMERTVPNRR